MLSLFFVQNGKKMRKGRLSAVFLLSEGPSLFLLKLEEFVWISKRKWLQLVTDVAELLVKHWALCFTPLRSPMPKGQVVKKRECQSCATWGFPCDSFLFASDESSWAHNTACIVQDTFLVKIHYAYCIMKVYNTHNLSHGSQIHYWALTYEPTDL